ncbi:hypothetical protein HAX54_011766, partial [Datura stramonium]|nr:hypothetical protein [Datura stramonium]
ITVGIRSILWHLWVGKAMMEETRAKTMEDNVRKIEAQLQAHMAESVQKFDKLGKKMDLLMEKLLHNPAGMLGNVKGPRRRYGAAGTNPCSWLRKCERYFHYNNISDLEQKVEEAVLHLNGRVEAWCGDKYFVSHQCKQKQINAMTAAEGQAEIDIIDERDVEAQDMLELQHNYKEMDEAISLNALSGTKVPTLSG